MEDRETTERLKQAGDLLGIKLLDHVVIGDGRYFSFTDQNLL
jgi:DNA repair protein RadC